jgi:hypothetical protein
MTAGVCLLASWVVQHITIEYMANHIMMLYVKIHCKKYITKMTASHAYTQGHKPANLPLAFQSDKEAIGS